VIRAVSATNFPFVSSEVEKRGAPGRVSRLRSTRTGFGWLGKLFLSIFLTLLGASARAQESGRFVKIAAFPSRHIDPVHVVVWLPPGYVAGRERYGVVYMHDGQNLFFRARSNFDKVWAADKAMLAQQKRWIIVGIDQPGAARFRQYAPQAIAERASPAFRASIDRIAQGPLTGDAYLRFLTEELKPAIDRNYRTRPEPAHTAIVGSSMGGLISCYAFARYPTVFGRAGCVSTHWPLADPRDVGGFNPEVVTLWSDFLKRELGGPKGRRLWLDHGTATLDAAYPPYQRAIDAELTKLGWRQGRDVVSKSYEGAPHEENAWAARLPEIFAWLLK
jgi:predicted alpha/beta superfamily hydrolase